MDLSVFANATFFETQIWVNKNSVVFWYLELHVSIQHVASRGAVRRNHIIVRSQTRTRRKDGTENFGGFVYVLDGFLQRDVLLWVCMCSINFSLFFCVSFPVTTPRATTPHRSRFRRPRRGLPRPYRCIQANRLPRLQGYHSRATTLQTNFWVQAGYHTCG